MGQHYYIGGPKWLFGAKMVQGPVAPYVGRLQLQWMPKVYITVASIPKLLLKKDNKYLKNVKIMAILRGKMVIFGGKIAILGPKWLKGM